MIPVEPTPLRVSRGLRLLGGAFIVGALLCVPVEAAPVGLPPGAVLTLPPGAVVVPGPMRLQAKRQGGDFEAVTSTPTVSVQVIAPATAAPGKGFTYRIVAENTSDAPAHHVYVKATLSRSAKVGLSTPAGEVTTPVGASDEKAKVVTWSLGTLAARDKKEQTLVVTPTGDDEVVCSARVQFEHGQLVRTRIGKAEPAPAVPPPGSPPADLGPVAPLPPAPPADPASAAPSPAVVARPGAATVKEARQPSARAALRLTQTPPASALLPPNETFTYKYEVTNVGTAPAKEVVVEAVQAEGLTFLTSKPSDTGKVPITWKLDEIAPGVTKTFEYSIAGQKVGTYLNKAVVTGAGGLREAVEHEVRIGLPKLVVRVTGPAQRGTLREATYHITVKNAGAAPALDVELSDEPIKDEKVSDAVKAVRADNGGKIASNIVRWSLGSLAPGGERTVSVVLQAKGPGKFTYLCTARSKDLIEQGRVETEFVEPGTLAVELDRITNATTVKVGAEVAYTLRLRNGGATENTNVDVVVSVPEGLELIEPRPPLDAPKNPDIRLPLVQRLTAANGAATLRFRATKPRGAKISIKAVSAQTGPDKAARLEEIVAVSE